jgi:hypothetical protein
MRLPLELLISPVPEGFRAVKDLGPVDLGPVGGRNSPANDVVFEYREDAGL